MSVALIRHGQTDWNLQGLLQGSSDVPLNATGRQQARDAVGMLRSVPWDVVVSSPLARARETAAIIAEELDVPLGEAYDDLVERDYGELEGTSSSAAIRRWPDRAYPGAESIDAVVARGLSALERIASEHADRAVLTVCHGTIIRYTLARLAGRPVPGIENGSVSMLRPVPGGWTVATVNGVPLEDIPVDRAAGMPSRFGEADASGDGDTDTPS
ncbi:MAG: histidine phosphatase family protein [Actinomycetales bacterium]|nr:histidine phosphatase family protein [Actinomycetales bacterium]